MRIDEFRAGAQKWLTENAKPRIDAHHGWGVGSDRVAVFYALSEGEERRLIDDINAWQRCKYEAGFGAISWPEEFGGRGLDPAFEDAFVELEANFDVPVPHELPSVSRNLIAPTVRLFGNRELRERLVRPMLRGDIMSCQLFSEPSAGSDLAGVSTRAVRDGDHWIVNGQKVWSSGAHLAQWGELIARTDPDLPKHAGLTAFMLPLDLPGIEIRPLRQMSGGASFCEVFFTDVRIPDSMRLGDRGAGWKVALTTLGFERGNSSNHGDVGGSFTDLVGLTRYLGTIDEPSTRARLADVYCHEHLCRVARLRDQQARAGGGAPGPVGSLRKMQWVAKMNRISEVATAELGPRLIADTGEWGTFAWTEHVLGAPGYRIAGGSDEIQRNIIAERLLGMPADDRVDRDVPWNKLPKQA
jgi:alkylation response protein AidB-like acyl-CoA dehydrogenase